MLIIRFRHLTELRFDADSGHYCGKVILGYSFPDDPGATHQARLQATAAKARQARYSWVESAILDAATRILFDRFAAIDDAPANVFAPDPLPEEKARAA
ncbi:MAG: hypothetical protein MUF74_00230 [Cypionkella sp.]|jgi:hypothetical protein|nr:hypothetical protein [Cypionkella sp.]